MELPCIFPPNLGINASECFQKSDAAKEHRLVVGTRSLGGQGPHLLLCPLIGLSSGHKQRGEAVLGIVSAKGSEGEGRT